MGVSLRHQDPRLAGTGLYSEIDKEEDPGSCKRVRGTLIYISCESESESGEGESASWMSGRAVGLDSDLLCCV